MNRRLIVNLAFVAGLALLLGAGTIQYLAVGRSTEAARLITHTEEILHRLEAASASLRLIESSQRGYVITGDEIYLEPFGSGRKILVQELERIEDLTRDNPSQEVRLRELRQFVARRLSLLDEGVRIRRARGLADAAAFIRTDQGRMAMGTVRGKVVEMEGEETRLMDARRRALDSSVDDLKIATLLAGGTGIVLFGACLLALKRDVAARETAEATLAAHHAALKGQLAETEARSREIALLGELGEILLASASTEEVRGAIAETLPRLVPGSTGAVYAFRASRNLLEAAAWWPAAEPAPPPIAPDGCWALRRGREHISRPNRSPRCGHIPAGSSSWLCVPMVSTGEVTGLLTMSSPGTEDAGGVAKIAAAAAGQLSLALSNLSLRETLLHESIRDPLTGLFNRRFLEAEMAREIPRARRSGTRIGVVLFDLDHFKIFNDTQGHLAGDALLREVGRHLASRGRKEDIACRWGGEEFLLVLLDTTPDAARAHAEEIRKEIERLSVGFQGRLLGSVTISAGIAVFPEQAGDLEGLIGQADQALYAAKKAGRNRVVGGDFAG
jgi:diguanylate cyclase (GGDEF)-like protein